MRGKNINSFGQKLSFPSFVALSVRCSAQLHRKPLKERYFDARWFICFWFAIVHVNLRSSSTIDISDSRQLRRVLKVERLSAVAWSFECFCWKKRFYSFDNSTIADDKKDSIILIKQNFISVTFENWNFTLKIQIESYEWNLWIIWKEKVALSFLLHFEFKIGVASSRKFSFLFQFFIFFVRINGFRFFLLQLFMQFADFLQFEVEICAQVFVSVVHVAFHCDSSCLWSSWMTSSRCLHCCFSVCTTDFNSFKSEDWTFKSLWHFTAATAFSEHFYFWS